MGSIKSEMVVIGGGPAGCAAALNAQNLGVGVVLVESNRIGGQVWFIDRIRNLPGGPFLGAELAKNMELQLMSSEIPTIRARATQVSKTRNRWHVSCDNGDVIESSVVVAATGSREMQLIEHPLVSGVPCAFRDSFIFKVSRERLLSEDVVIVGCDRDILPIIRGDLGTVAHARIVVLALPDKWYVIRDQLNSVPFSVIPIARVCGITSGAKVTIDALTPNGETMSVQTNLVLTNLGKMPASELFVDLLPHDQEKYLAPKHYVADSTRLSAYPVGDVAHKAFQRISVAIGDGACAALDYYYGREKIHQDRSASR